MLRCSVRCPTKYLVDWPEWLHNHGISAKLPGGEKTLAVTNKGFWEAGLLIFPNIARQRAVSEEAYI